MLCAECGSEMRRCTDPIKETFRGEEIMVTGIEHYLCDSAVRYCSVRMRARISMLRF